MWTEPIVEGVRAAARHFEAQASGDVHKFFALLREAQVGYRFRYIEVRLAERRQDLHATSVQEMNALWEEAKT